MPTKTLTLPNSPEVRALISSLPRELLGRGTNKHRLYDLFWTTIARTLFSYAAESYDIRSHGGTDALGNSWKPLSPRTVASRPISATERAEFGIGGKRSKVRPSLTPRQDKTWRGIFYSTYTRLSKTVGDLEAKKAAAQTAWAILKSRGAVTLLDALSSRNVLILQVTKRLFKSFQPSGRGGAYKYIPRPDQEHKLSGGDLTLGTLVPYASKVFQDRPVFDRGWEAWVDRAVDVALNAVLYRIHQICKMSLGGP